MIAPAAAPPRPPSAPPTTPPRTPPTIAPPIGSCAAASWTGAQTATARSAVRANFDIMSVLRPVDSLKSPIRGRHWRRLWRRSSLRPGRGVHNTVDMQGASSGLADQPFAEDGAVADRVAPLADQAGQQAVAARVAQFQDM